MFRNDGEIAAASCIKSKNSIIQEKRNKQLRQKAR